MLSALVSSRFIERPLARSALLTILCCAAGYHALPPTASASAHQSAQPEAEVQSAAPNEEETTGEGVSEADIRALDAMRDEVQSEVERIRGIEAGGPVTIALRTREELRARLVELIEEDLGPREILLTQRIVEMLGLLDPSTSYLEMMLDLLEEQVAGYYDFRTETFYLLESDVGEVDRIVIAHELMHALQDARWSLEALQDTPWSITDVALARSALVEGEATVLMGRYAAGDDSALQPIPLSAVNLAVGMAIAASPEVPRFFMDTLVAPYIWGMRFATELWFDGGWNRLDEAWDALPMSTEVIEWPERYIDADEPTFLTFGSAREAAPDDADIIGVTNLRAMWVQLLMSAGEGEREASARAREAAEGWDGDRLDFWLETETLPAQLLWLSVWDTEEDAREAYALQSSIADDVWCNGREPESDDVSDTHDQGRLRCAEGDHGERCGCVGQTRALVVERWGDLVLVAMEFGDGVGEQSEARLLEQLEAALSTHRRFTYPEALRSR